MFQLMNLIKTAKTAESDAQEYTLVYRDLENEIAGYTFSTAHGTEEELRAALKESMTPAQIDILFIRAA